MARNIFNSVKMPKVGSNWFDLTHDVKFSCDMGKLVPILCEECIPGDKFQLKAESMLRFAPLVSPVMHRVKVYMHYFFVPNRLVWSNWEEFISPEDQNSGSDYPAPYVDLNSSKTGVGTLSDYLGIPPVSMNASHVSAIPFAAYHWIYDEYYKDQNLFSGDFKYNLVDGDNVGAVSPDFYELRTRAWQHDYFTAALPWAQKGDDVLIPIGNFSDLPVHRNSTDDGTWEVAGESNPGAVAGDARALNEEYSGSIEQGRLFVPTSNLEAEAQSITSLRRAFKLQEWLEKNARGGTRYVESMLVHFGVKSSDARLNRPEYIGGYSQPMVISEVLQTAEGTDPVGNMAGHGISVGSSKPLSYFCEEHGYLFCILSVMPVTAYQQGIPRKFIKFDPFQYAWPTFQHIGEQEIYDAEVYAVEGYHPDAQGSTTFGYVPRYSEYKFAPSRVAGEFRTTLSHWHMGRIFDSAPSLNGSFVSADPTNRVFAVEEGHKIWAQVLHANRVRRKLAKYGNPML